MGGGQETLTDYFVHHEKDAITDAIESADRAVVNRQRLIIGTLYENDVISRTDVDQIATGMGIPPDEVSQWFVDGFPDPGTIAASKDLQKLIHALSSGRLDTDRHRIDYENGLWGYRE